MRFAYADPPYIGQAKKHYEDEPDYAGEVDHRELIERLDRDYDGWALSASSPSLREVLPLCPEGVRVEAWIKPFAAYKRNIRVAYAWEPVIVRELPRREGAHVTRDFVCEPITMKKGLTGAKPERVCFWLFNVAGLLPGDVFDDLYPGTGGVSAAWGKWSERDGPKLRQIIKVQNMLQRINEAVRA
jgi:hypothetical protein